ncbi:lectin-like protein [Crocosphaera watsonii]|uniref:lectin-like protein n=1 Tax=Crocosphaera watsonii TaxID=263511 RepID=UPI0030DCBA93
MAVSSNGLLSFGGIKSQYTNTDLMTGGVGLSDLPSILPFWDDLETRSDEGAIAEIYTQTIREPDNRQFIVQWHQVEAYPYLSETGNITFQVILSEGTNSIQFNYLDVNFEQSTDEEHSAGKSATIGIWNNQNQFQQYSFNQASLQNGLSLIVTEQGITEATGTSIGRGFKSFTYDPTFNQLTSYTDELGHQTLYDIDPNNGNVLSITEVIGEVGGNDDLITQFTYTANGLVDTITDALGRITDNDYDTFGRLISMTYAVGTNDEATRQFEYDTVGNQTAIIDENGNRTEFEYDALNRLISITEADPDGEGSLTSPITSYTYDADGNLLTTTDPENSIITNEYDVLNRLIQTTDSLNQVTTFTYDSIGNLLSVVDPLGNETQNIYDERYRLIETIDPEGIITRFDYDLDNNLITVIENSVLETTNWIKWSSENGGNDQTYLITDNVMTWEEAETTAQELGGHLVAINSEAEQEFIENNILIGQYERLPLWIGINDVENEGEYVWTTGETLDFTNWNEEQPNDSGDYGTINWHHSRFDTNIKGTWNDVPLEGTVGFEGFTDGLYFGLIELEINDLSNKTTFEYDARNRLISETDPFNNTTTYEYDVVDNLIAQTDRSDRRIEYQYDDIDRLIQETWIDTEQVINYSYDKVSNLTSVVDQYSSLTYTYDNRDRLIAADNLNTPNTPHVTLNYTYDDVGNMLSVVDTINGVEAGTNNYNYDALNRLIELTQSGNNVNDKSVNFAYNALGQYTSMSRYSDLAGTQLVNQTNYNYDDLNRLTNIGHNNGTNDIAFYNYAYDASSRITQITDRANASKI